VMAKFVAENQQVKQILETNMQTLKDSLEKQGLNVQGFSVSVGQDSRNRYGKQKEYDRNNRTISIKTSSSINVGYGTVDQQPGIQRLNAYKWGSSTINLTA